MTSVKSVAGELRKYLHTRGKCHSALEEKNIRICFAQVGFTWAHDQRGGYREWDEPTRRLNKLELGT
jgi:hypothetical protein